MKRLVVNRDVIFHKFQSLFWVFECLGVFVPFDIDELLLTSFRFNLSSTSSSTAAVIGLNRLLMFRLLSLTATMKMIANDF